MELLKRFRQGDPEAFEALFRQFQAEVYGWIVRIVRDPSAAEDLTIETFWRIHSARGRFDPGASFGAWARRIATNLAIDHSPDTSEVALPDDLAQPGSADPIECRETRRQIAVAFSRLPLKLRVAATLSLDRGAVAKRNRRSPRHIGGRGPGQGVSRSSPLATTTKASGCEAMNEQDHDDIRRLLQDVFPRANAELRRDLWPAMSRTLDTRPRRVVWYDWALAGLAGGIIAAFPDLILVLFYHL